MTNKTANCKINLCILSFMKAVALVTAIGASQMASADVCWKDSYGRGVGTIPGECKVGIEEKSGLLCYPKCKPGYNNVAGVCWQNCPSNFSSTGVGCAKPKPYGRGAGYVLWDEGKCNRENRQGCEKNGLMWYPRCQAGFHSVGCCVCSPNCPAGMVDEGATCRKNTYVVAPILPGCESGKSYDAGLCYKGCDAKYKGIGPVCWGECPAGMTDCGAMCGSSASECAKSIGEMVLSVGQVIAKVATAVATLGAATAGNVAAEQAKTATINIIKEAAKKIAKDIAKKLVKASANELKPLIANELRKIPNMPSFLVDKLSDMASEPDGFDYISFLKGLDPTGLVKVVDAFNKKICGK